MHVPSQGQYHYDFSYSLAFQDLSALLESAQDSEKQFIEWNDILLKMEIIQDSDFAKVMAIFSRLPLCRQIGLELLEICQLQLGLAKIDEDREIIIEAHRQKLYIFLKDMGNLFGQEKSKYLPFLCLVYYSIIFKIIESKIPIHQNLSQNFVVFHYIYWELKGQLATKQLIESLINEKFDKEKYQTYINSAKIDLIRINQNSQKNKQIPFTLRESLGRRPNFQGLMMSKNIMLSSRNGLNIKGSLRENISNNIKSFSKICKNQSKQTLLESKPISNQTFSFIKSPKAPPSNSFRKLINKQNQLIISPLKFNTKPHRF